MSEFFELEGSLLTVRLPVEVDHPVSDLIRRKSDRIMADTYIRTMVFDFRKTCFMDSSGIGLVMGRFRELQLLGGKVRALHANERVRKILKISGVSRVIEVVPEKSWNL